MLCKKLEAFAQAGKMKNNVDFSPRKRVAQIFNTVEVRFTLTNVHALAELFLEWKIRELLPK